MEFRKWQEEQFKNDPSFKKEFDRRIKLTKFIEKEFGFKNMVIDFDEIKSLKNFKFRAGKYYYRAIKKENKYRLHTILNKKP
jgi:hypothetical protein